MTEEESGKTKEAEKMSRSQSSSGKKQQKRITGENKKVTANLNEQETGPRSSLGKNKEGNTNLPLTEDKSTFK